MVRQINDYNKMRAKVSRYHHFTFRKRDNSKYTPAQKSAIRKAYTRLADYVDRVQQGQATFIRGKRHVTRHIDGVRTAKGIFYKYPNAKIQKKKIGRKTFYTVKHHYKQRREVFFPFPPSIYFNLELIMQYVDYLVGLYHPDYIMWSRFGVRAGGVYTPENFYLYSTHQQEFAGFKMAMVQDVEKRNSENISFFNGVFFGWFPETKLKGFLTRMFAR